MSNQRRVLILAAFALLTTASPAQVVAFDVPLDGDEQVPPNATVGYGTSTFTVDLEANTLTYAITAVRLDGVETAAHLHGFAPAGGTAPVLLDLPLGKTKTGTWSSVSSAATIASSSGADGDRIERRSSELFGQWRRRD